MRCIEVESEHLRKSDTVSNLFGKISSLPEKLFGHAISLEDILLIGLIILLFAERRREKELSPETCSKPPTGNGSGLGAITDLLGKLGESDMLILMLIYLLMN